MKLTEIIGNNDVRRALLGMVASGRVPHALMFFENDGCGAYALAEAFLQRLFCSDPQDDSCGECPSCNKISKQIHPDVHFIFPVAGTGTDISLSTQNLKAWRELVSSNPFFTEQDLGHALGTEAKASAIALGEAKNLISQLALSSVQGGWQAVVIYLPEKMNAQTANKLLKSIEEPPQKTVFLLITHAPEKVLQTISSRCQGIRVLPLSKDEVVKVLVEKYGKAEIEAEQAALMSGGSVGRALEFLSSEDGVDVFRDLFTSFMDALAAKNLPAVLEAADAMAALDSREKQKSFCKFAGGSLRKIFMIQQKLPQIAGVSEAERAELEAYAARFKKNFPREAIARLDKAMYLIDRNVNQKVLFCDLADQLFCLA